MKKVSFSLLLTLLICNSALVAGDRERVLIYAHRGASWAAPENTLAAFKEAVRLGGVDYLELDLHLTRDGEIVVIHDETVDRTTNGKGKVHEMTLAQIEQLDAGSWFNRKFPERASPEYSNERIPTLRAVIDFAKSVPIKLYLDSKIDRPVRRDFERKLSEILDEEGFTTFVVVESRDLQSLHELKSINPSVATSLSVRRLHPAATDLARQIGASEIVVYHGSVNPSSVLHAHREGFRVIAWTIDEPAEIKKMIAAGVDGIITNRPDIVKNLIR